MEAKTTVSDVLEGLWGMVWVSVTQTMKISCIIALIFWGLMASV